MKSLFIVLTIVLLSFLYSFLNYNKNNNIQTHLDKETIHYTLLYNTLYEEFKSKSQLIYDLLIDTKEIKNIYKELNFISQNPQNNFCNKKLSALREQLYNKLEITYPKLKKKHKVPTIHFHTKNNLSFLRMDKYNKFCDDLTQVRPLIVKTNTTHHAIDGFEVGKTTSKYRFVFPILDKGLHLGSVEISYNSLVFINEFMDHSNALAQIHVKKEIVDKKFFKDEKINLYYSESPLKGMYIINKLIANLEEHAKKNYTKIISSQPAREEIEKMLLVNKKPFSLYDEIKGDSITVIPIINPASNLTVGYFTTKHFSKHLQKEKESLYNHFFVIGFLIILIMILTYKYFSSKMKRSELLAQKNEELAKKQQELEDINLNLEQIVSEKINENLQQQEFISKQSKIAALGEMMDAIAHQWKQPLNIISMTLNNLVLKINFKEKVTDKDILNLESDISLQINHLIITIDDFRKFFRPDQSTSRYKLKEVIDSTLNLEKDYLIQHKIDIDMNIDEDLEFDCIKTEFIHVIINLINNTIDAFNENNIENRLIKITAYETDEHIAIEVCDNAGGIPEDILPHIFKSNYTSKEKGKGTGIGLYLYKQIIEKIDGSIDVFNKEQGICFKIMVKKIKEE